MHRENGYHGDAGEISWKGEQNPKSSAVRQQKQKGFDSVILWYIFTYPEIRAMDVGKSKKSRMSVGLLVYF